MLSAGQQPIGLCGLASRAMGFERHAGRIVELGDELVEQADELGPFLRGEGGEHMGLRAPGGLGEALEHALARLVSERVRRRLSCVPMLRPMSPAFSSLSSTMPVVERSRPSSFATEI